MPSNGLSTTIRSYGFESSHQNLPFVDCLTGIKSVYIFGLLCNCIGTAVAAITSNLVVTFISGVTIGILYATLSTVPFILLTTYHKADNHVKVWKVLLFHYILKWFELCYQPFNWMRSVWCEVVMSMIPLNSTSNIMHFTSSAGLGEIYELLC